jgi:hypothetical protein
MGWNDAFHRSRRHAATGPLATLSWRVQQLSFFQIGLLAIFAMAIPPVTLFVMLLGLGTWDWLVG